MTLRKTLAITIAVAAICCFAGSGKLLAQTGNTITYTASGTFGSPVSGADGLELSGEPFSVSIAVSASTPPFKSNKKNWAAFNKLKLTGTVHSGIEGPTAINIGSNESTIIQAIDPDVKDIFTMEAPVAVAEVKVTVKAVVVMPAGTLKDYLLYPFSAVTLTPTNATLEYTNGTNSTVLAIGSGTLTATLPAGGQKPSAVLLHSGGAQAITLHADGTQLVRSLGAPVDLGMPEDTVTLKFYASGVRYASEVHVQIAGEEVPVRYAGPSGYFQGLDEVAVQVPRSLAGRGDADVILTADGETAGPVRIHIQ